jgi:CO/xanthine dehydrogenase Mo-binding subunit
MSTTNWNRDPKNSVGKARRRVDARARVTGQVRFADDLSLPRMLHCRLVRSHVPHAKILGIDASKALARKGVKLVLTGEHFPIAYGVLPVSHDEHPLCNDKVRFVGDPVAAVIATTEEEAIDAANDVVVHYESLTTIATPQEALATPEPRIHTTATRETSTRRSTSSSATSTHRSPAPRTCSTTRSSTKATRTCRSRSTRRSRSRTPKASSASGRRRRRRITCTRRWRRRWRWIPRTSA